ncbi:MAG: hypothetical protein JSR17_07165 [Proteobacteria bacterium]|nr:hypothetical protein [Pseudomonadota bacterium]
MKNQIFIKCSDAFDTADFLVLNMQGVVVDRIENGKLAELAQKIKHDESEITILIASSEIVIKQVTLPKKFNSKYLSKIVPNILEEDLVSSIDSTHFSFSKVVDSKLSVAIIAQDTLKSWLEKLKSYQLEPDRLCPLSLSMDPKAHEWQIWIDNNTSIVKTDPMMGFCIETTQLPIILNRLYQTQTEKPHKIQLFATNEALLNAINFKDYPALLPLVQNNISSLWEVFHVKQKSINLLQSTFAKQYQLTKYKDKVKHGIAAFIVVVALIFGFQITDILSYSKIKKQQQSEIEAIYRSVYPNATEVVSPKLRMERDLKSANILAGGFFDLLLNTGIALNTNKNINLKNLTYKQGALTLTIETAGYTDVEKFIKALNNNKLDVKQDKTEQHKDKLSAILIVHKALTK